MPHRDYTRIEQITAQHGADGGALNRGIWLVRSVRNGQTYVEKKIASEDVVTDRRAQREVRALKQLRGHPNVNRIHDYLYDGRGAVPRCHLFLEYCDLGALDGVMLRFAARHTPVPEPFAWHVFYSIASALAWCHYGTITSPNLTTIDFPISDPDWNTTIHRDLKIGNIFLSSSRTAPYSSYPRIVLGDFGLSFQRDQVDGPGLPSSRHQSRACIGWKPPECPRYSLRSDVYQLGAVLHSLCLLLKWPDRVLTGVGTNFSSELDRAVMQCLRPNPADRPSSVFLASVLRRKIESWWPMGNGMRPLPAWAFDRTVRVGDAGCHRYQSYA
ncbi:hypothetical protein LTR66_011870 [Elasticomyces elasticus]|nr:hypothetical protein LTR66_011870 [Elasticomyces elasticus]